MRLRLLGLAAFIAALSLSVPITSGAFLSGSWSGNAATPGDLAASLLPAQSGAARALGLRLTQGLGGAPAPVTIGNQIAGTFGDATGHSAQSHLVYAVNSHLWWLFTLTSANDSNGGTNHVVKAYVSSGPDLTTATWSAAADSPTAAAGSPNGALRGGRSLGVAYLNNSPTDVIHADISMAFDGQNGRTGHIRAVVTGTTIAWGTWNFWDEPAATWTLPHGNVVGVSSGRFIHTGGPILQQEVDANARRSTNADTGSTWSNGFSNPTVFDGTMKNQNNAMAFAPLANNVMLAVYDNGQGTEPTLTNLRYTKSNASGTWPAIVIGSQTGGNGDVFPTAAAIDQNDWGLAALDVNQIYVFRRKASGGGIDAASYNVAGNSWSPMSPAPPAFGQGQAAKAGVGVFAANDGVNVFVCVVNTDAANTILCARFDGAAWSAWTAIPGTDVGVQTRRSLSGSPQVGNGLVGLIWTEGASIFDIVTTSFVGAPDVVAPTVAITAPLDQAGATGTVSVTAMASDNVAVAGVQFKLDGADLGVEVTSAPYSLLWNTETAFNGTHTLTAIARDAAGNTTTAAAVSVTVTNLQTPIITWPPPARLVHGAALGPTQLNATANTPGTFVYTPAAGTILPLGLIQTLSTTFTPDNKTLFKTTTASVTIDVVMVVPDVVGQSQAIATTTLTQAGLTVGTVTQASSLTVPAGAVISQTPPGNTETGVVGPVDLVVSTGAVSVPNVVGLTQSAASAAITNASLTVGPVTSTSSTTVASGLVISHNPTAGTQVTAGSAVALVVSSGPPRVAVPNVVGLTQAAASTAITNAGLTVGTITTASSTTIPSGSVISENPTAGTQIATGSAVALVVSSGPPQATVPNVVGLTQAAASAAITNAGLVVGVVTNATSTTVAAGSVISQSPNAGVAVPTGSPIALLVSTGPPAPATLAIDKTVSVDGTGTVTTPPFSTTAANELLVLFATSAGPLSVSPKQTLAITSAGLTWTLAVRSNAQFGTAEVWTATAAAPITNGTVTSVQSVTNGYHQSLTLIAFTGSGGTGATAVTSASFGATSIALTATKAASVVYMAANDSARAVAHAVPADQVLTHQWVDTVAATTFWVQTLAAPVATPGTVTINNPTPTSDRWNAAAIEILVGAAPPPSTVPNVVGSTQTAATDAIVAAGLVVGSVTISASSTVPAGSVISETPIAGAQVPSGSAVALVVSSGPPQVAVPDVVGLTQSAASTAITNANLVVGTVTTQSSTTVPSGSVTGQNPTAGTQIVVGSAVALVVSSGPPQVAVPDVVGLTQSAASTAITNANLVVGTVTTQSSTTVPSGSVIGQNPTAGTQIVVGSAVALVVSSGPPQVAVPNVVGLTQSAASTAITNVNLVVGAVTTQSSTTVPSGSVISQNPTAGTQIVVGSAVALVVSSGPPQVAVPDVVGLTQSAASTAITNVNLVVGAVTTQSSTTVPSGSVISQNPTAGTQIVVGSAVALVVSSGPPQVAVPDVVGLTQSAATTAITNANLVVGTVTTQSSPTVPSGSVISQNPTAGTQIVVGSAVALVVSSGPPQVAVPNVVGLTQSVASTAITNAGLTVGTVTTSSSTTVPSGSVISQNPTAGTQIVVGSAVALVVSSGPPAPGVLSIDKTVSIDGTGTVATPAFSTTGPNELLVLFATSAGPTSVSPKQMLAITGAGLTWTLAVRSNAQFGTSEIWTATAAAPITNGTVTSVQSVANSYHQSLTLIAFSGASGTGATAATSAGFGPTSIGLTTTKAASVVYMAANDSARAVAHTVPADQSVTHLWVDSIGTNTFWVQTFATPVAATGTAVTLNNPTPTSDRWNAAAIEILAGAAAAAVPDVVGLTQAAASDAIVAAGLLVGTVTTSPSATVPSGSVVSQNPTAGTQVATGSTVALVVSSGPPQVAVPNVVGLTQSAASTAITNAGLTVGTITTSSSATAPAGSVISQNPTAGTQIVVGSAVALVVSSGPPAPIGLAIDTTISIDGTGTVTTPAFSTTGTNELLVLFATSAGPLAASLKQTLSVSGAGLTWTLAVRSNTQFGTSEIWTATAATPITNGTVTSVQGMTNSYHQSMTLIAFTGAGGTGATAATSASFGATAIGLTTTRAASVVYMAANDSARAAARAVPADQVVTHEWVDTVGANTFWVQTLAAPVATAGTAVTLNNPTPTSDRWNAAAIEIVVSSGSGSP